MFVRALKAFLRDSRLHKDLWLGIFVRYLRKFDLGWIRRVLSFLRFVQMIRGWIRIRLEMGKWMAFNEGG